MFSSYLSTLVPSGEWTVEEAFQWMLLQELKKTDDAHDAACDDLMKHFDALQKELFQSLDPENGAENIQIPPVASTDQALAKAAAPVVTGTKARVEIVSGPHKGAVATVAPTARSHCPVGRSRGKNFKQKGFSLYKDCEVSTTHGKFLLSSNGRICYMDSCSTNGSFVQGEKMEPDTPLQMENGMEIVVGQSTMTITLL